MSQRSQTPSLPWVGAAALAAATFGAGAVLARPGLLGGLLQPWYLTRAAGIVAFVLLWLSVCIGILQSTQFLKGAASPLANIDIHTFVSLGAVYATTFHIVILMWDRYVPFTPAEILVPFAGDYKPVLVGLGSVGLYVMLGVIISTYLRGRLSARLWRSIHISSVGAFALALAHAVLLGTDRAHPLVSYLYRFAAISVAVLLAYRVSLGVMKRHANPAGGR